MIISGRRRVAPPLAGRDVQRESCLEMAVSEQADKIRHSTKEKAP